MINYYFHICRVNRNRHNCTISLHEAPLQHSMQHSRSKEYEADLSAGERLTLTNYRTETETPIVAQPVREHYHLCIGAKGSLLCSKGLDFFRILSQMCPRHTRPSYFFKIQFYRYNIKINAEEIGQEFA
jgi:hypothetical protein